MRSIACVSVHGVVGCHGSQLIPLDSGESVTAGAASVAPLQKLSVMVAGLKMYVLTD